MVWINITRSRYFKVLFGMTAILAGGYLMLSESLILNLMIVIGIFWLMEHIYTWEEFSFRDIVGHEWAGLILCITVFFFTFDYIGIALIVAGSALNINWKTKLII